MTTTLQVVDDFLPDPFDWRCWAMQQDWKVAPEFQGHRYPGCIPLHPDMHTQLADQVEQAHGGKVRISLAFARMSLAGDTTPAWIHADNSIDSHAGVLYLTRPNYCAGGTAFWYHNELGWDRIPSPTDLKAQGVVWDSLVDKLNTDANDTKHWTMTGLVGMKYNRFVSYPTNLFHSRWPQQSLGTTYDNGRLIVACFYSPTLGQAQPVGPEALPA